MRPMSVFVLTGAFLAAFLAPLGMHSASAQTMQASAHDATTANSDFSAQKKKKKVASQQYRYNRYGYRYSTDSAPVLSSSCVAPSFGYIGPPGYAGEYAWRRSIGQCVEDLGYGRWAALRFAIRSMMQTARFKTATMVAATVIWLVMPAAAQTQGKAGVRSTGTAASPSGVNAASKKKKRVVVRRPAAPALQCGDGADGSQPIRRSTRMAGLTSRRRASPARSISVTADGARATTITKTPTPHPKSKKPALSDRLFSFQASDALAAITRAWPSGPSAYPSRNSRTSNSSPSHRRSARSNWRSTRRLRAGSVRAGSRWCRRSAKRPRKLRWCRHTDHRRRCSRTCGLDCDGCRNRHRPHQRQPPCSKPPDADREHPRNLHQV